MKILRFLVLLLTTASLVSFSFGQITLTSTDVQGVFAAGKSWTQWSNDTLSATTMNLGVASSSSPGTWTMPTVIFVDTSRQVNMNPSATPYASSFPQATHSQRQPYSSGTRYQYNRITADSLIESGEVDSSAAGVTITQKSRIDFLLPAVISQFVTVPRDSQYNGPGSWQIQTRTSTMDAYGTLIVPAGSFQTLRRKDVRIQQNYSGSVLASTDTTVDFLFLTKDNYFLSVQPKFTYQSTGTVQLRSVNYNKVNPTTGVRDGNPFSPAWFHLDQNYPDPFNPSTTISFDLQKSGFVTLKVYNVLGQEVADLVNEVRQAGSYKVIFNSSSLGSGVYFYTLNANNFAETRKMLLVK